MKRLALTLMTLTAAMPAAAVSFMPSIDQSIWAIEASPFECRLSQAIPAFGVAIFEHEAGEDLRFVLRPATRQQLSGSARLVARAAPWQPGMAPESIAEVSVRNGEIHVGGQEATRMLASLKRGLMPTFSSGQWYGSAEPVSVGISAVNFPNAYDDFLRCVTELLPVNYGQIARTAVLFPSAAFQLSDAARERLELIVQYVQTDSSVQQIFVDGHSDNVGRRLLNRDLSKRRAEEVTRYLVSRGISEEMIVTRYHGDRYPVVPNNTADNRLRNRRVTIRLERE